MELGFWGWSFWSSFHLIPCNRYGFGYAFTRAFFSEYGVTELEKTIRNLSILVARILSATTIALAEQEIIIDSLPEIVLPNCRVLDVIAVQQSSTYALLDEESILY